MVEIKLILWDIGGVIQPDDITPEKILGISHEEFAAVVELEPHQEYLKGFTDIRVAATHIVKGLGRPVTEDNLQQATTALLSAWEPPRADVISLIKRVPGRYRQMILSTVSYDLELRVREAHKNGIYPPGQQYLHLFRESDILFSNRIHATKNEAKSFAAVSKVSGIDQKYWLFIDDRPGNLKVALEYGVGHVLQYTTTPRLEAALTSLGVLGN